MLLMPSDKQNQHFWYPGNIVVSGWNHDGLKVLIVFCFVAEFQIPIPIRKSKLSVIIQYFAFIFLSHYKYIFTYHIKHRQLPLFEFLL